jgi:hypothetical protein
VIYGGWNGEVALIPSMTAKKLRELWKIVWGVWGITLKLGQFPDAENMTIEWVGAIP